MTTNNDSTVDDSTETISPAKSNDKQVIDTPENENKIAVDDGDEESLKSLESVESSHDELEDSAKESDKDIQPTSEPIEGSEDDDDVSTKTTAETEILERIAIADIEDLTTVEDNTETISPAKSNDMLLTATSKMEAIDTPESENKISDEQPDKLGIEYPESTSSKPFIEKHGQQSTTTWKSERSNQTVRLQQTEPISATITEIDAKSKTITKAESPERSNYTVFNEVETAINSSTGVNAIETTNSRNILLSAKSPVESKIKMSDHQPIKPDSEIFDDGFTTPNYRDKKYEQNGDEFPEPTEVSESDRPTLSDDELSQIELLREDKLQNATFHRNDEEQQERPPKLAPSLNDKTQYVLAFNGSTVARGTETLPITNLTNIMLNVKPVDPLKSTNKILDDLPVKSDTDERNQESQPIDDEFAEPQELSSSDRPILADDIPSSIENEQLSEDKNSAYDRNDEEQQELPPLLSPSLKATSIVAESTETLPLQSNITLDVESVAPVKFNDLPVKSDTEKTNGRNSPILNTQHQERNQIDEEFPEPLEVSPSDHHILVDDISSPIENVELNEEMHENTTFDRIVDGILVPILEGSRSKSSPSISAALPLSIPPTSSVSENDMDPRAEMANIDNIVQFDAFKFI